MAIHGKTDALASAPKYVTRKALFDSSAAAVVDVTADTINLSFSNTGFSTGDEVLYSINGGTVIGGLTDATVYYVRAVAAGVIELYDTYAHAVATGATTGLVDLTAVGVGSQSLQRTGASNVFGDHTWNGTALVFADRVEAALPATRAKGIKNPGWWLYRTWTNGDGSVAQHAECLVVLSGWESLAPATTGDQADDAILADA